MPKKYLNGDQSQSSPSTSTSVMTRSRTSKARAESPPPGPSNPAKRRRESQEDGQPASYCSTSHSNKENEERYSNDRARYHAPVSGSQFSMEVNNVTDDTFNSEAPLEVATEAVTRDMFQKAKELRRRVVRCILKVFNVTDDQSSNSTLSSPSKSATDNTPISARHINKLADFLEQSLVATAFMHCNLKSNIYVNKVQDIFDFTDILYRALGSFLILKTAQNLHPKIVALIKRLLNLLQKQNQKVLLRAVFNLLALVDNYNADSNFKLVLNSDSSKTVNINASAVYSNGFITIMKMLYPYWTLNKFSGTIIASKFLDSMIKTWYCSSCSRRCDLLVGFPQRIFIRDSKCQFHLVEVVEQVLTHILKFGLDNNATTFLNQIWRDQLAGDAEPITFFNFKVVDSLVEIIFGDVFITTSHSGVKEFIIHLFDILKKTCKNFECAINQKFDVDTIKDAFDRNPEAIFLLDSVIYDECVSYTFKLLEEKERAKRRLQDSEGLTNEHEDKLDDYTLVDFSIASETWKTLIGFWMSGRELRKPEITLRCSRQMDEQSKNTLTKVYVLTKLANTICKRLSFRNSSCSKEEITVAEAVIETKISYLAFNLEFMKRWTDMLHIAVENCSIIGSETVIQIAIESMYFISSARYSNMSDVNFIHIKKAFILSILPPVHELYTWERMTEEFFQEYSNFWKDPSTGKWLQNRLRIFNFEIFDGIGKWTKEMLPFAMKKSKTGILKGVLGLLGDFNTICREISLEGILAYLTKCAKIFGKQATHDNEFEVLLAKAFTRVVCFYDKPINRLPENEIPFGAHSQWSEGCDICDSCTEKSRAVQIRGLSDIRKMEHFIMNFAKPFFKSESLEVKLEMTECLVRFKNHFNTPNNYVLEHFLLLLRNPSNVMKEKLMTELHNYLECDLPMKDYPPKQRKQVDYVFKQMFTYTTKLDPENYSEEILSIVGGLLHIAKTPDSYIQRNIVQLLSFLCVTSHSHKLPALYSRVIQTIAEHEGLESHEFMGQRRNLIAQAFLEKCFEVVFASYVHPNCRSLEVVCTDPSPVDCTYIKACCDAFNRLLFLGNYGEKSMFMEHFAPVIISEVLPYIHKNRKRFLFLLGFAKFASIDTTRLLVEYFPLYYHSIALCGNSCLLEGMMNFLQKMNVEIDFIASCCFQSVTNELASHLNQNAKAVFQSFQTILKWVHGRTTHEKSPTIYKPEEIRSYISTRLPGLYVYIQSAVSDRSTNLITKLRLLRSFKKLMTYLKDKHLYPTKFKLYIVLSSLVNTEPNVVKEIFNLWNQYSKHFNDKELPDMIVQIIAATTLLNPVDKEFEYDTLLSSICLRNMAVFKLAAPRLYFVKDYIQKYIKKPDVVCLIPSGKALFELLVHEIGHFNSHVRFQAIKQLREVLVDTGNGFDIQQLISERTELHPDVWNMLLELMRNCRGSVDRTSAVASECIGLIGAVDPYRISIYQSFDKQEKSGCEAFDVLSPPFLAVFLDKLTHLVQNAFDGTDFDIFAYTIQEVLRLNRAVVERGIIWGLLPAKARSLIEPMFKSRYHLKREPEPECTFPIFGSNKGSKFHDWAFHFIFKIISCMKQTATPQEQQVKTLFDLSKLIAVRCPDFAFFLLPHVVLHGVLNCIEEDLLSIISELNLVMTRWIPTVCLSEGVYTKIDYSHRDGNATFEAARKDDPVVAENLRCTNAIFTIVDHVSEAIWRGPTQLKVGQGSDFGFMKSDLLTLKRVSISKNTLSRAAFGTGSFHRALRYYEESIAENSQTLQPTLSYLQRVCVALDDIDSIAGISAINTNVPSKHENVIASLALGRREDSAAEFQRMFHDEPDNVVAQQALIQAYLSLDQPHLAYNLLETHFLPSKQISSPENRQLAQKQCKPRSNIILHECRLEACWRMEKWDELDLLLKSAPPCLSKTWECNIAQALFNLKDSQFSEVMNTLDNARQLFIAPLTAIENDWDSYVGRYGDVVRIHILSEVQQVTHLLELNPSSEELYDSAGFKAKLESMLVDWKRRLHVVQNNMDVVDPILNVRKVLLKIVQQRFKERADVSRMIDMEMMSYLLKIAKLECREKNYTRAKNCIFEASKFSPMVFIQEAKFLIKSGDTDNGLIKITKGLENNYFKKPAGKTGQYENEQFAKALLLYAQLNDKLRHVDVSENIKNYNKACEVYATEKNYFNLANYFDRILEDFQSRVKKPLETQKCILNFYCSSLKLGCKHIYQSLPRLLSIWFDHAKNFPSKTIPNPAVAAIKGRKSPKISEQIDNPEYADYSQALKDMTASIDDLLKHVPGYVPLTAFSQLVSRLCHNDCVWVSLKNIIANLVCKFPRQTLWMLTSVLKSSFLTRSTRCIQILKEVCLRAPNLQQLVHDYGAIAHKLIGLSNNTKFNTTKAATSTVEELAPGLTHFLKNVNKSDILIPFEQFLSLTLPCDNNNYKTHVPFPEKEVYMVDVESRVDIMSSLQKPKKVVLRGSNGKSYGIMCKPNDDLRKDSKVMEFNGIVNWYLSRAGESCQRNLHIRTYAVTPLNEQCGIVEWINNLQGYRATIMQSYKDSGLKIDYGEAKKLMNGINVTASFDEKKKLFDVLVKMHPLGFSNWFKRKYRNPQTWYKARLNYIRTAAVMSVVGYIMGLGDRHGENILLDTINGDLVHVDFNCIFNKGETLEWTERVPFRLTRNFIDGFGPLGYEGVFRKTCEITLKIIRDNMEIFLSTMQPFIFDPLVEWSTAGALPNGDDINSDEALKHLNEIRLRLLGEKRNMTKTLNVRLSVEAQVGYLIQEATDKKNLCQMYPGWSPFL